MFKSYTRKSSAQTGAQRAGLEADAIVKKDGAWGFYLPDTVDGGGRLPKLSGGSKPKAEDSAIVAATENIVKAAVAGTDALAATTAAMMGKVNDTLGDIKALIFAENKREEDRDKAAKLRALEDARERDSNKPSKIGAFMTNMKERAGGLLNFLKGLAIPLVLGGLAALDKKFGILKKSAAALSKVVTSAQEGLDAIADLPLFKNNILGTGIRNLLPIATAFGAFALWKPGKALAMLKGVGKFIGFFGNNPAVKGLEKLPSFMPALGGFGRIMSKIFLPLTIVTSLWETGKGAIDGYKNGGIAGAFKGALDGLIHGLIGGLIDTVSQGIGWILEQFGVEAEGFKNFKFGKFLEELGSNLGLFVFDIVDSIKNAFSEAIEGIKGIFNSDEGFFTKLMQLVTFPVTFIINKMKAFFSGKSLKQIIGDILSFATANGAVGKAAYAASRPEPKPAVVVPVKPSAPASAPNQLPQIGMLGRITGSNVQRLEAEARERGLTQAQIDYTYETDRLIGAPRGATLAQIKQESGFNSKAVSPTGAVGLTQFTSIAVKDVIARGRNVDPSKVSDEEVARTKAMLANDPDKALLFQRALLQIKQSRSGKDWLGVMRDYNGDVSLERNGMQARDNYIQKIAGYLGTDGMSPVTKAPPLATATEQAQAAKDNKQAAAVVAPVSAPRTTINNQTTNHLPNLSASIPVEFAPHVA